MPHYRADGDITWMRSVMFAVLVVFIELSGSTLRAGDGRRLGIHKLNDDRLGESLNQFRSLHKEARCVVRPIEWSDERSFKRSWLSWVDCSLEKSLTFKGQQLLAEVNPDRPFGVFASFHKRKLIELSYTVSITSIETLLAILYREYGKPNHITRDRAGFLDSATWANHAASLDVEIVAISPAVVDGAFLRIGKGLPAIALQIRIRSRTIPPFHDFSLQGAE